MKNKRYSDFENWFEEPEAYGLRAERFYALLDTFSNKEGLDNTMRSWLEAAFNAGREKRRGCKFPDCHCVSKTCEYIHKITRTHK